MLTKEEKNVVLSKFAQKDGDTGSVEVQVALFTYQINKLTEHMKQNPKDYHSNRGLLKMVGRRKNFMRYLMKHDVNRYRKLVADLGLRK